VHIARGKLRIQCKKAGFGGAQRCGLPWVPNIYGGARFDLKISGKKYQKQRAPGNQYVAEADFTNIVVLTRCGTDWASGS
jgi:hypothetical protein